MATVLFRSSVTGSLAGCRRELGCFYARQPRNAKFRGHGQLQTTSFSSCGTSPFLIPAVPEPIGSCSQRELSPSLPPFPFKRLNSPPPPPPKSKSESSKWHHEQSAILPQSPVPVLVLHERVLSQRRAWGEFIAIYLGVTFYRRMICRGQLAG